MKKHAVAIIGIVLLAVGVLGYMYFRNSSEANRQNNESATISKSNTPKPASNNTSEKVQPGAYVAYSEATLAQTTGTRILFFHAPWCPQCRALNADLEKATLPQGVTIFKVDYDSHQELRKRYDVTLQTTFVKLDTAGDLVKKFVAYNEPNYASVKAELIN